MNKLDRMIEEALDAEDRAVLAQYGEKGLFGEVGELLSGKFGWINIVQFAAQLALFAGFIYAAFRAVAAEDPLALNGWAALVIVLMMAMSVIKIMQWQQIQANRVIREVKRVELQLARSNAS